MEQFWEPKLKIRRLLPILCYGELFLLPGQPAIPHFCELLVLPTFKKYFKVKY